MTRSLEKKRLTLRETGEASADEARARIPWVVYQAAFGILLVSAWQFTSGRLIDSVFVSSPGAVWARLVDFFVAGEIWPHFRTTVFEFITAYIVGAFGGIVFGIILGRSVRISKIVEPYILALYAIPKIALAPLFIIWFGIGTAPKIAIGAIACFFLVFVNVYAGLRAIDEEYINLARIMGADGAFLTRTVIAPAAAPHMMIGLRTGIPYAMIGVIVGEFIVAQRGLGYLVARAGQLFDSATLFAAILVLIAVVMVSTTLVAALERRVIAWRPVSETRVEI